MTADKEKRRATSREAARKRRRVESDVFGDLSRLLPLQPSIRTHLDKPSVIRLTLSYIRMHTLLKENAETRHKVRLHPVVVGGVERNHCNGGRDEKEAEESEASEEMSMYLRTLEGFLMVLSTEGDMIFLSDNVTKYMGLTQTELMGHNIFEYTHPCDHEEIRHNLRLTAEQVWCGEKRDFVIRIKSALTHRGRSANLKSATWKVLHCQGRVKVCMSPSSISCLLLTCRPLPLSHTLLSTHTFTSQHSMDMKFTYCDQRVISLLGYTPEELVGRSLYDFCHTLDYNCLSKNHLNLCLKSQSVSGQYRMLVRGGGYVWVESHSAVIPSVKSSRSRPITHQPLCILSVTYVLSGVEEPTLQLSLDQTIHRYLT
ncbi:endothelial PAS domain-containing protein 1-like [Stegastes partitus]|uniref:Endothelial PAS domain-containing protein 1-like n=1 Tax=Stegastes partitus TaxID=144197 RepID=A0A9Y4TRS8_9TELE|nr:PREDICTED: endothelial PAS domain-containing protein 1-like [Stegastes partitus]